MGEPVPLESPIRYRPFDWPAFGLLQLENATLKLEGDVNALLERRRTDRQLGPASLEDLSALLKLTCRTQHWGDNSLGFFTSLRPTPSAGSIHPVHVLATSPNDDYWMRYLPDHHAMECLNPDVLSPADVRAQLRGVVGSTKATILLFIAEPEKTAAKYANPCSLVWRDAGNLQGFIALAAEALSLGFCSLGITGESWARLLDEQGHLAGVGVGLFGTRQRTRSP